MTHDAATQIPMKTRRGRLRLGTADMRPATSSAHLSDSTGNASFPSDDLRRCLHSNGRFNAIAEWGSRLALGLALEFLGSSTCVYMNSGRYRPRLSIGSCGLHFASAPPQTPTD